MLDDRCQTLAIAGELLALDHVAPRGKEPIPRPRNLDVEDPAPTTGRSREHELHGVRCQWNACLDHLATGVDETSAEQVRDRAGHQGSDQRLGSGAHERAGGSVREVDPEPGHCSRLVAHRGADHEGIAHGVQGGTHRRLRCGQLPFEPGPFAVLGGLGKGTADCGNESLQALLQHVVGGPRPQGLDHDLLAERTGHEDARHAGIPCPRQRDRLGAREAGHRPVRKDQVRSERLEGGAELARCRDDPRFHDQTAAAQRLLYELGVVLGVLDQQDAQGPVPDRHRGGPVHWGTLFRSSQ